jgi:hypothetical protein
MPTAENKQERLVFALQLLDSNSFTRFDENYNEVRASASSLFDMYTGMYGDFRVLQIADILVCYSRFQGYDARLFFDLCTIGSDVVTQFFASGVAARGAIAFGDLHATEDGDNLVPQACCGQALDDALRAQREEESLGVIALPAAWKPAISLLPVELEHRMSSGSSYARNDEILLLNPFPTAQEAFKLAQIDRAEKKAWDWQMVDLRSELDAFKYLNDCATACPPPSSLEHRVAQSCSETLANLRHFFVPPAYKWLEEASRAPRDDVDEAMLGQLAIKLNDDFLAGPNGT